MPEPKPRWTTADGADDSVKRDRERFSRPVFSPPAVPERNGSAGQNGTSGGATNANATPGPSGGGDQAAPENQETIDPEAVLSEVPPLSELFRYSVEELRSLEGATNRAYALRQGGSNNEGGLPQVLAIPRKFLPRVRKPNGPPKFKGVARNRMITDVHVAALEMFGVATDQTGTHIAPTARLPAPPDNPDGPPPVGVQNLRYAWNRPPGHYYNQAVADNFARAMIASDRYNYQRSQFFELRTTFFVFVGRTLRDHYKNQYDGTLSPFQRYTLRRAENARARRYRLFQLRRAVTLLHPSLNRFTSLIDRLTPDGMSSDDEDTRGSTKRYLVSQKPWRSLELKQLLRALDRLGVLFKVEARGQSIRFRVDAPERRSAAGPVRALPKNAYHDSWNSQQEPWQRIIFNIQLEEEFDFSLPEWAMRSLVTGNGPDGVPMEQ